MRRFVENGFDRLEIANLCEVLPGRGTLTHVDRKYHGVVYYYSAHHDYVFSDGHVLAAKAGAVLYLPKGSSYRVVAQGETGNHCIAINFYAQTPTDYPPFAYARQSALFQELFERALRAQLVKKPGYQALILACLYGILAQLQLGMDGLLDSGSHRRKIAPAVDWLAQHYAEPSITVSDLAARCRMSDVRFRSLFKEVYGVPPLRYLHTLKLDYAKDLVASGEYTVAQAAERAGFADLSAFYRIFREIYHTTPKQFVALERTGETKA